MSGSTERRDAVLEEHEPAESGGGYIACLCGWPSKAQWEAGEHYVLHVIEALRDDANKTSMSPENAAFYEKHYSTWNVIELPVTIIVPMGFDGEDTDALELVAEILDNASFDIRVEKRAEQ